jgi:translation initiation factor 2D
LCRYDAELPMRCELFYTNCVLPSRPEDVTLDLKKSTFKKQAKLFSVMEKKKVIVCKAIHKFDNIVTVNRDNKAGRRALTPPDP